MRHIMKPFKFFCLLFLSGFFNSCYEQSFITLDSSIDGILQPIKISIPVTVIPKSDNPPMNACEGSLSLNIYKDPFRDLKGYLMDLRNLNVKWVTIEISGEAEGGVVENLRLTVGQDYFHISKYLLGNPYDSYDSKLIDMMQSVFDRLLPPVSAVLELEVSGDTKIDTDTVLCCVLTIDYAITIPSPLY